MKKFSKYILTSFLLLAICVSVASAQVYLGNKCVGNFPDWSMTQTETGAETLFSYKQYSVKPGKSVEIPQLVRARSELLFGYDQIWYMEFAIQVKWCQEPYSTDPNFIFDKLEAGSGWKYVCPSETCDVVLDYSLTQTHDDLIGDPCLELKRMFIDTFEGVVYLDDSYGTAYQTGLLGNAQAERISLHYKVGNDYLDDLGQCVVRPISVKFTYLAMKVRPSETLLNATPWYPTVVGGYDAAHVIVEEDGIGTTGRSTTIETVPWGAIKSLY